MYFLLSSTTRDVTTQEFSPIWPKLEPMLHSRTIIPAQRIYIMISHFSDIKYSNPWTVSAFFYSSKLFWQWIYIRSIKVMTLKHTSEVSGPHICTHLHIQTASHMVSLQHDFQNWNLSPFQKPNFLNLIYHTGLIRLQCFWFSSWYVSIHEDCCLMVCNAALSGRHVSKHIWPTQHIHYQVTQLR